VIRRTSPPRSGDGPCRSRRRPADDPSGRVSGPRLQSWEDVSSGSPSAVESMGWDRHRRSGSASPTAAPTDEVCFHPKTSTPPSWRCGRSSRGARAAVTTTGRRENTRVVDGGDESRPSQSVPGRRVRQQVPLLLADVALESTTVTTLWAGEQAVLDPWTEQPASAPGACNERLHLGPTVAQRSTLLPQFDVPRRVRLDHV
jgi:hypothetical protein